jgi:hypothetical protein
MERKTLAVFLLQLELHHLPQEAGGATSSTKKKQGKSAKQIMISQRVLETGKWKL